MSIFPAQLSRREHMRRLTEYRAAIARITQVININLWSIIICENTFDGSEIELRKLLNLKVDSIPILKLSKNTGAENKGIGELDMMTQATDKFSDLLKHSTTVSYMTGRHIVANDQIFKLTESLVEDALISNPDFFYLDGRTRISEKNGLFNDMFFSMRSEQFLLFVEEFKRRRTLLIRNRTGSEQFLYSFITENKISYSWMNHLGLIRREIRRKYIFFKRSELHIC
jgi:hypothetical protein